MCPATTEGVTLTINSDRVARCAALASVAGVALLTVFLLRFVIGHALLCRRLRKIDGDTR